MCNNGRRVSKIVIIAAVSFSVFFAFFSCSNLFDDIATKCSSQSSEEGASGTAAASSGTIVNFTGTVSASLSGYGAIPSEYNVIAAEAAGASGSNSALSSRSAIPQTPTSPTYEVTAVTVGTTPAKNAPVGSVSGGIASIALETGYRWAVTVTMKATVNGSSVPVLSDTYTMESALSAGSVLSHDFLLTPVESTAGGFISLGFSHEGSGDSAVFDSIEIASVKKNGVDVSSAWNAAVTVDATGISMKPDDDDPTKDKTLASGVYVVTLNFKKGTKYVYYTTQTMTVLPNLTTNKWVSSYVSGGAFHVTQAMIDSLGNNELYVGANPSQKRAPSDNNAGTPYSPLATFGEALKRITNNSKDYTIHVSGEQKGNFTLGTTSDAPNFAANSVTLCGMTDNTTDILNGTGDGSVITVSTTKPVTIKDLKITGGNETNGGGIYIASGANVTLANGAVVAGNKATYSGTNGGGGGGGVYNAGTLFMYGSAVIGDSSVSQWATGTSDCSNYSSYGGGLYNAVGATAYLGYSATNTPSELTGGICFNYSQGGEAGAVYNKGVLKMNSGRISYNGSAGYTGGVTSDGSSSNFELSGGAISYNRTYAPNNSNLYAGGVRISSTGSRFTMTGGEISYNESNNGGGISLLGCTATFTGGVIKNNTASEIGSGIIFETGTLNIGGSAVVASGNDIWLNSDNDIATVTIYSALTGTVPVATLTPGNYSRTSALLTAGSGVTLANEIGKFAVTDNDTTDTNIWTLDSAGKLKSAMTVTAAITSIESMSGADNEVLIAGAITPDDITSIKSAISSAYTANGTTRIKLDLSNVTGLTELPYEAFKSLSALEEIILPEGIETLKSTFFCYGCSNLKSVYIPSSVTEFGAREFYGCPNLESITVADGNTALKVENDAVYSKDGTSLILYINKSNTDSFVVPDGVNRIDDYAFCQSNIISILLPDTLEYIGNNAFYYGKLNSINIPDGVTLESYAFYHCSLTSVRLPNDLEELGYCTFSGCGFTEITLPASIKKIGESYGGAFSNCDNLTTVNYRGTEAQRNAININDDKISNATWNYNYTD